MRKPLQATLAVVLSALLVSALPLQALGADKAISAKALQTSLNAKVGNPDLGKAYKSWCLKFVADQFAEMGAVRDSTCCAAEYGRKLEMKVGTVSDLNNVPIGADVFFTSNSTVCSTCTAREKKTMYAGHVGIYVGGGYVIHAMNNRISKDKVATLHNFKSMDYVGWAPHRNVTVTQDAAATTHGSAPEYPSVGAVPDYLPPGYVPPEGTETDGSAGGNAGGTPDTEEPAAPVAPAEPAAPTTSTAAAAPKKPAAPKLKTLKAAKKRVIKVTWKKVKGATGYQVKYASNKKFKQSLTKTVKASKTSLKLKARYAKQRYYVKVRAYKTVNGKKYYSKWSSVKSVKTKR